MPVYNNSPVKTISSLTDIPVIPHSVPLQIPFWMLRNILGYFTLMIRYFKLINSFLFLTIVNSKEDHKLLFVRHRAVPDVSFAVNFVP